MKRGRWPNVRGQMSLAKCAWPNVLGQTFVAKRASGNVLRETCLAKRAWRNGAVPFTYVTSVNQKRSFHEVMEDPLVDWLSVETPMFHLGQRHLPLAKGHIHRSLGHRPRKTKATNRGWLKAIFNKRPQKCWVSLAFSQNGWIHSTPRAMP